MKRNTAKIGDNYGGKIIIGEPFVVHDIFTNKRALYVVYQCKYCLYENIDQLWYVKKGCKCKCQLSSVHQQVDIENDLCIVKLNYRDQAYTVLLDVLDADIVYNNKIFIRTVNNDTRVFIRLNNNTKILRLSRFITEVKDRKIIIDHKNGNTLDHRRTNLRITNHQCNTFNSKSRPGTSSFKGVCADHRRPKKWRATITIDGQQKWLGYFNNEIDAAKAYDEAAKQLFGEFARLNFPEDNQTSAIRTDI